MDFAYIKHQFFQNFMMKCWTMLKIMSLKLKKYSVSENVLIFILILVVLILINFWLIVIAVVFFAIGRYSNRYKAENKDGTDNSKC